jgi:hypothetical protein
LPSFGSPASPETHPSFASLSDEDGGGDDDDGSEAGDDEDDENGEDDDDERAEDDDDEHDEYEDEADHEEDDVDSIDARRGSPKSEATARTVGPSDDGVAFADDGAAADREPRAFCPRAPRRISTSYDPSRPTAATVPARHRLPPRGLASTASPTANLSLSAVACRRASSGRFPPLAPSEENAPRGMWPPSTRVPSAPRPPLPSVASYAPGPPASAR